MNIKKEIFSLIIISTLVVGGCTSKETKPTIGTKVNYEKLKEYPKWVIQPTYEDGLAGIGSGNITDLGFDFARKEAMANARTDLAGQIETKVNNLFKSYASRIGIGKNTNIDSMAQDTTKQVIDVNLMGASLKETWISPKDELFVLMTINNDDIKDTLDNAFDNFENNNSKTSELKLKSEDAQDELKKELDAYFGD